MKKTLIKIVIITFFCLGNALICTADTDAEEYNRYYNFLYNHIKNKGIESNKSGWLAENILYYSAYYSIDPILITALIEQESNFNLQALSEAGAVGVTQILPSTAESIGIDVYDPTQNLIGGIYYFALQMAKFSQSGEWQTTYALASYNAGAGAVEQYGGVPPYPETIAYINSIAEKYNQLRSRYKQI